MNFKRLVFFVIFFASFSYAFVYSNFYKAANISLFDVLSKNIYLNSPDLNSTYIVYKSDSDISKYSIKTGCRVSFDFVKNLEDYYFFKLTFKDNLCSNGNFYLQKDERIFLNTLVRLDISKDFDLINSYTDYSSVNIKKLIEYYDSREKRYELFSSYNEDLFNYDYLKKKRYFYEVKYKGEILNDILLKRDGKYQIPIVGYELPTLKTKLPNSARPYRGSYTDGIHEGWDLDAPFRTEVVALDNAIVLKVINNFKFSDLNNIKYSGNLSLEDKVKNLDILRGNQVWLKTMKGDAVFYAHLDQVYDNIKAGEIISKGTPLGKVGITGVPDKNYSDYHLHFEVRKNPYDIKHKLTYSLDDYLKWDWYFKGEKIDYIKDNQYNIFEK